LQFAPLVKESENELRFAKEKQWDDDEDDDDDSEREEDEG